MSNTRVVITGIGGFLGRNLRLRLEELGGFTILGIDRTSSVAELAGALASADFVCHLAGINRPPDPAEFASGNVDFTRRLCSLLAASGRTVPVLFSSSTQAALDNPYGRSKLAAETALRDYASATGAAVYVFRLPNVFGKWCRPHYNSVVATFCHQIARGLPITITASETSLRLAHVDDVVAAFISLIRKGPHDDAGCEVAPVYETTVGELARILNEFYASRSTLLTPRVGAGLVRALYATYISYLPPESFGYAVPRYTDSRGEFVEMLKTPDCGQFSYFTAPPGVTRGEHYHHSKTEKFLIVRGSARFEFRNLLDGQRHEVTVHGGDGRIVETVPGWVHRITNVGVTELVVMLWANEVFDRSRPDTIATKVAP